MSLTEKVLETKQAKEAIYEGALTWLFTGNFQRGWDAMIARGKKNGSYLGVKIAFVLDVIKALGDNSKK